MSLTQEDIRAVQESWKAVQAVGGPSGHAVTLNIFYPHLHKDPAVKLLFKKTSMPTQATKLWDMLSAAVEGLTDLDALVPVLQGLGRRHVKYGVTDKMYDAVGASLLYTLEQGLGPAWTPELQSSWVKVYTIIATTMKAAARDEPRFPELAINYRSAAAAGLVASLGVGVLARL